MKEEDLKKCPFCGGDAYYERIGTNRVSCIVTCSDCGANKESGETGEFCGESWNERLKTKG